MSSSNAVAVGLGVLLLLWWLTRQPKATVETEWTWRMAEGTNIYGVGIRQLARAIARAEGFYVAGSLPARAHNPGDLIQPWRTDLPTMGAEGITVFPSDADGWEALHRQLWLIASGQSRVYSVDMTLQDMAERWAPGSVHGNNPSAWAANVALDLGVSASATLAELL